MNSKDHLVGQLTNYLLRREFFTFSALAIVSLVSLGKDAEKIKGKKITMLILP